MKGVYSRSFGLKFCPSRLRKRNQGTVLLQHGSLSEFDRLCFTSPTLGFQHWGIIFCHSWRSHVVCQPSSVTFTQKMGSKNILLSAGKKAFGFNARRPQKRHWSSPCWRVINSSPWFHEFNSYHHFKLNGLRKTWPKNWTGHEKTGALWTGFSKIVYETQNEIFLRWLHLCNRKFEK